jgi:hypothetical protein
MGRWYQHVPEMLMPAPHRVVLYLSTSRFRNPLTSPMRRQESPSLARRADLKTAS